jgi:hypothetical protein
MIHISFNPEPASKLLVPASGKAAEHILIEGKPVGPFAKMNCGARTGPGQFEIFVRRSR